MLILKAEYAHWLPRDLQVVVKIDPGLVKRKRQEVIDEKVKSKTELRN